MHFKAAACEAVRLGADREALQLWRETIASWLRVVVARWREVEYANPRDKDRTGNERERERSIKIHPTIPCNSLFQHIAPANTTHSPHLKAISVDPGEGASLPSAARHGARPSGHKALRAGATGSNTLKSNSKISFNLAHEVQWERATHNNRQRRARWQQLKDGKSQQDTSIALLFSK